MEKMQFLLINKEALRVMIQEQERIKAQQQKNGESFTSDPNESISEPSTPHNISDVKEKPKVPPLKRHELSSSDEDSDAERGKKADRHKKVFTKEEPIAHSRQRVRLLIVEFSSEDFS